MENTLLNSYESNALYNEASSRLLEQNVYQTVSNLDAKVTQDGNQWCCLYGIDLQVGISGWGNSPFLAMQDFCNQLHKVI